MYTDISKLLEDTEQYWCPIHQANHVVDPHQRYLQFMAFGDAQGYQQGLKNKRQTLREE